MNALLFLLCLSSAPETNEVFRFGASAVGGLLAVPGRYAGPTFGLRLETETKISPDSFLIVGVDWFFVNPRINVMVSQPDYFVPELQVAKPKSATFSRIEPLIGYEAGDVVRFRGGMKLSIVEVEYDYLPTSVTAGPFTGVSIQDERLSMGLEATMPALFDGGKSFTLTCAIGLRI